MSSAWNHDFPCAEQNLVSLLKELTLPDANNAGSLILRLDDPARFRYPIGVHVGARLLGDEGLTVRIESRGGEDFPTEAADRLMAINPEELLTCPDQSPKA